jgi:hypothetical protein
MCGIVGLISRRSNGFFGVDLDILEGLLVLDTLRGLDSTGVFSVDHNRNVNYMKVASHPYHLFACEDWAKWRAKAVSSGRIVIGHNRKATQGEIKSANAHPFHENNIILVHNGTLRGDHKKMADTEVDSHALCHAFNEKGAENVIPTINGAFALVWWDIEKNKLFAIRNDERPLNIVVTDNAYVLCSEAWMAGVLLDRQHIKVQEVIVIEPGVLYEFSIGGAYTTKPVPLYTTPVVERQVSSQFPKPNGGALSVVRNPTTQTSATNAATTGDDVPKIGPEGHVACLDYPNGIEVLVKLYEMQLSNNKAYYICRGKTIEPDSEAIDVVGYLRAAALGDGEQMHFLENPVLAKVFKHTSSTCGRSLFVNGLHLPKTLKVHNGNLSQHEWDYVVTGCKCQKCQAVIYDEEREYTSVSRRTGNKIVATCADCVEDTLTGEYKHAFTQDRLASLQEYERVRQEALSRAFDDTSPSSSASLH